MTRYNNTGYRGSGDYNNWTPLAILHDIRAGRFELDECEDFECRRLKKDEMTKSIRARIDFLDVDIPNVKKAYDRSIAQALRKEAEAHSFPMCYLLKKQPHNEVCWYKTTLMYKDYIDSKIDNSY